MPEIVGRGNASDDWRVYAACRDPASASELRRLAEDSDDKMRILAMDVTDPASIHAAATELDGADPRLARERLGRAAKHCRFPAC